MQTDEVNFRGVELIHKLWLLQPLGDPARLSTSSDFLFRRSQTCRYNPCRLSVFFISSDSHHCNNIRHHILLLFMKNCPLIRSIISWCCIFILLDWLILRWHYHSFWMMFSADLSRSSEKDMLAVLYHKNKGPAEAFGCPFYRVMRRLRPKSVRLKPSGP